MSRISKAHFEITQYLNWISRSNFLFENEIEIDSSIQHYHRNDRYRQIQITSSNKKNLEEIKNKLDNFLEKKQYNSKILIRFERNLKKKFILDITIWS